MSQTFKCVKCGHQGEPTDKIEHDGDDSETLHHVSCNQCGARHIVRAKRDGDGLTVVELCTGAKSD